MNVCWPTNAGYLQLHACCKIQHLSTGTNWVATSYAITNGFGTNFCTVSPLTGNLFFRLSQ